MKGNNNSNDSLDQALANTGLINRFKKILNSDRMDEWTAESIRGVSRHYDASPTIKLRILI